MSAGGDAVQLLVLEISCGKNLKEEVVVNCGDSAIDVARAFTDKHKMKQSAMRKVSAHIETCLEQYLAVHPQEKAMHEALLSAKKYPPSPPVNDTDGNVQADFGPSVTAPKPPDKNDGKRYDDLKKWWGDAQQDSSKRAETDYGSSKQSSGKESMSASNSSTGSSTRGKETNQSSRRDKDKSGDRVKGRDSGSPSRRYQSSSREEGIGSPSRREDSILKDKSKVSRRMTFASAKKPSSPNRGRQQPNKEEEEEGPSKGAKAANRLYQDGRRARQRRESLVKKASLLEEEEMKRAQFKVKGESRQIVQSTVYNHKSHGGILNRLYKDGLKQLAQRKKAEEVSVAAREEKEANENWSCARCGVYHPLPPDWIKNKKSGKISPRRGAVANNIYGVPVLVCPNCDFEQSGGNIYTTPQLHVHLNLQKDSTGNERVDYVSRAERERREVERKMMLANKMEHFRKEHAPRVMSKGSQAIMAKYTIHVDLPDGGDDDAASFASAKSSVDPSHPIATYMTKPALERLAGLAKESHQGAQKNPAARRVVAFDGSGSGGSGSGGAGGLSTGDEAHPHSHAPVVRSGYRFRHQASKNIEIKEEPRKKSRAEQDAFLNRLCYEDEKEKEKKRQALVKEHYSHDKVTGQKLFKPLINEGREHSSRVTGVTTMQSDGDEVAIDKKRFYLANRDYDSFEKRKKDMEEAAERSALLEIAEFKATSKSDQIVRKAEKRTVSDIFCALLDQARALSGQGRAGLYAHDAEDWDKQMLDLQDVRSELLIPEIARLVLSLRFELIRGDNEKDLDFFDASSMVVSLSLFSYLVEQHTRRLPDNRVSKSYFFIPESKLNEQTQINDLLCNGVSVDAIEDAIKSDKTFRLETQEEQREREQAHKPQISKHAKLKHSAPVPGGSGRVIRRDGPVHEMLHMQGEAAKKNLDEARRRIETQRGEVYTFKPFMHKPPSQFSHIEKKIDVAPVVPSEPPERAAAPPIKVINKAKLAEHSQQATENWVHATEGKKHFAPYVDKHEVHNASNGVGAEAQMPKTYFGKHVSGKHPNGDQYDDDQQQGDEEEIEVTVSVSPHGKNFREGEATGEEHFMQATSVRRHETEGHKHIEAYHDKHEIRNASNAHIKGQETEAKHAAFGRNPEGAIYPVQYHKGQWDAHHKEKEYTTALVIPTNPFSPPPLPAEIGAVARALPEKDFKKQAEVATQLAKELFDASPRDPFKHHGSGATDHSQLMTEERRHETEGHKHVEAYHDKHEIRNASNARIKGQEADAHHVKTAFGKHVSGKHPNSDQYDDRQLQPHKDAAATSEATGEERFMQATSVRRHETEGHKHIEAYHDKHEIRNASNAHIKGQETEAKEQHWK